MIKEKNIFQKRMIYFIRNDEVTRMCHHMWNVHFFHLNIHCKKKKQNKTKENRLIAKLFFRSEVYFVRQQTSESEEITQQ